MNTEFSMIRNNRTDAPRVNLVSVNWCEHQKPWDMPFKVGAPFPALGKVKGELLRAMSTYPRKTTKRDRFLNLSKMTSGAGSQDRVSENVEDEYQLQLRVDENFYDYMKSLMVRSGVETASELVRLALWELERARSEFDGIKLSNDVVVTSNDTGTEAHNDRVVPFRKKTATRRVNVVLRGVAHQRLQRLIEWLGGRPLVDIVAIALGVLDTFLSAREEEVSSSSVKQPAHISAVM